MLKSSIKKIIILFLSLIICCSFCLNVHAASKFSATKIQFLIKKGKTEEVKKIFESKYDIDETDKFGNSALHSAALNNDAELITYLIFKGANVDLKNYSGDTPLHIAIKNNCKDSALILSSEKSNIFSRDGNGKTALSLAIEKGERFYSTVINENTGNIRDEKNRNLVHHLVEIEDINALKYCIKNKIPLSLADNENNTPLLLAYKKNTEKGIEIASLLLMAGCTPERGEYSYFEDCLKIRNVSMRFDDGQTPLHFAAIYGHSAIANYLVNNKAQTNTKDILGATPLHEAVRYGNTSIVRLLLKAGADPNSQDSLGKTPLLLIIPVNQREEIISLLLKNGANPNIKDMYGDTPLHLAAMTGISVNIMEKLCSYGADINERNKKGMTCLSLSVDKNAFDQVLFLTQNNADIHAEDNTGNSPLSRVLENKTPMGIKLLKTMVTQENINSRDSYGNTPIHLAVQKNASLEMTDYLLSIANDIDARNRNGDTPLYIAVQKNRRYIGEKLIDRNADVFSTNNSNYSPLRIALTSGGEILDWVMSSKVINQSDGIGNTPLHYACEWKLDAAVNSLLLKGANPNRKNSNGETPLFNAIKVDSPSTIDILTKKNANLSERDFLGNSPLHACVLYESKNSAMKLIALKADINSKNLAGKTPLAQACHSGRIAMANLLLEYNADINSMDTTGKSVLMDAVQSNNADIVSLLLKKGASVQAQEMYGRNAYHEAVLTGNIEIISLIEKNGGNPLSRDAQGTTPFALALSQNPEVIKAVLGSNRKLIDSDSNTPVHIAILNGASSSIIDMLIDCGYPIDERNREGKTALAYAVDKNMNEQVRTLLENNANPFIKINGNECPLTISFTKNREIIDSFAEIISDETDYEGEGILHYAAKTANKDTVKRLLSKGLDKTIRNVANETASDVAHRWGREDIAQILK